MARLRVGCIVDDTAQTFLVWDFYDQSVRSKHYELAVLIIQPSRGRVGANVFSQAFSLLRRRGLATFCRLICFSIIDKVESLIIRYRRSLSKAFATYPLARFAVTRLYVNPNLSPSGLVYTYTRRDIQAIKDLKLDLLVMAGSGILKGEILSSCPFGIISFHHGDNSRNRGGPPGFWEVFHKEPSTGFIVQRLTEELDGGGVLLSGSITTSCMYKLNQVRLFLKSSVFLHRVVDGLARSSSVATLVPSAPYAYPLYTVPTLLQSVQYVLATANHCVKKLASALVGRRLRWGVGYVFTKSWRDAVLRRITVVRNPRLRFFADPFVATDGNMAVMFVEDYDYRRGKGRITAIEVQATAYRILGVVLEEKFHVSFPYVFWHEGRLYMCPETQDARQIRLYVCTAFPLGWRFHKALMRDVSAVDTCIFFHDGRYWMLTNIDSAGLGEDHSELHAFHADRFDSDTWVPHELNPVIFSSQRGRNGGLFVDAGVIYRVYQIHGFDSYGSRMGVARIVELTPTTYREETDCEIAARFKSGLRGAHSFSVAGEVVCVDFARMECIAK
jgi:hypothetical protein